MKKLIVMLLYLTILTATSYAKTVPAEQKIAGLYAVFFNRAPDMSGLSYWKGRANIGHKSTNCNVFTMLYRYNTYI